MPTAPSSPGELLEENAARRASIETPFNPDTGQGAPGRRFECCLYGSKLFLPETMRGLVTPDMDSDTFTRLRCRHDFAYWAANFVKVKNKGGGEDVPFVLTRPQRRYVEALEALRTAGKPIRIILLKARQWGGSTVTQIYMAWLQLVHKKGLNSLIIAHQQNASYTIKDMFDRMLADYPLAMLHEPGEKYKENEAKIQNVGRSGGTYRVPQRNCKISIGTAERPDSCRGGDYNLVHCSEVGIWKKTLGKSPEDMIRSACSGILLHPDTMIVYESTANGVGNFFHREYDAAKNPEKRSQFVPLFISWFDIDLYSLPFEADDADAHCRSAEAFAEWLLARKNHTVALSDREESGRYLWLLWEKGATLEAIHWYIVERRKYSDHGQMASEYPSDDIEAFAHSGERVFDRYKVELLRAGCCREGQRGELQARADSGPEALHDLHFVDDEAGALQIWKMPDDNREYCDRYLTVVDIGGRSAKSDWSVIAVFDRLPQASGRGPEIVAQWRGHIDMDLLAWKAVQIASFYHESLLVIESNTLETRDYDRMSEGGDQSHFILKEIRSVYANLYARRPADDQIVEGQPVKYGFHTNMATKPMIISTLVKVIREGLYTERDTLCVDEYLTYERKPNGAYGAIVDCHDDLLMTRAIGLHIAFCEMPLPARMPNLRMSVGNYLAGSYGSSPLSEATF